MTDSPEWRRSGGEQWGTGGQEQPTQQYGYPGYPDPAYASQTPYGSPYQTPPPPRPTERLPAYSPYGYDQYGQYGAPGNGGEPPEPDDPKPPRWLWVVAGVAVVTAIGLVIALVIVNSSRQDTVMAPPPSPPEPSFSPPTTTSRIPPTTSRTPSTPILPLPTLPTSPSRTPPRTTTPGATDTVVYTVEGSGRAINITYVDTGGLLQTEFNVMLPWSKEVALPQPGEGSASISIINVGREVSCSISINGTTVEQRTGAGLTICTATG
ncbi:MmpS family transport accessory protein [Mycolicibacterium sp.]|uniref:MmpS family transport accessory protein n=1 Tax=Mycolicibacterium sp. TaxID=2320850 RepID=UPI003D0CAC2A